ncbi:EAL domain-containing protein [uncultured Methylobacterium sp.]|uniref:EAL domain-containing protein n=1 Tax=uncultured Methylobacterium sp. TaxID=157278 RepID=UPI0035C9728C
MKNADQCRACRNGEGFDIPFTMAFQPIVDLSAGNIWGYEALVRGPEGESAASILSQVTEATLYKFDQACRVRAIEMAGQLFQDDRTRLSINFMPNAVYEPAACIRASLDAARRVGFRREQLMFEFTENERCTDPGHLNRIVTEYRRQGFMTALDDFGAGYANMGLLANFQPDLIKIDMLLIRNIDTDPVRQAIVASIINLARTLGIRVIVEGVETEAELIVLRAAGATLAQGYFFAKPQIAALPSVSGFASGPAATWSSDRLRAG